MVERAIDTNAERVAELLRERSGRWTAAAINGLRRAVLSVEAAATRRLSGGGQAGSYPVPVRTGNLRRSMGFKILDTISGLVFNTARYAGAIHNGLQPRKHHGRGDASMYIFDSVAARPFLDDAVAEVKPGELIFNELLRAL